MDRLVNVAMAVLFSGCVQSLCDECVCLLCCFVSRGVAAGFSKVIMHYFRPRTAQ